MKFFKYLFILIVLVFVLGSLYIATISLPHQKTFNFETPLSAELFKNKIKDLSTYSDWFNLEDETTSERRLSNEEDFKNTTLSWQSEKFESITIKNQHLTADSITQQLSLKTWLSASKFDLNWKFNPTAKDSSLVVDFASEASFWQKTEYVLTGKSHSDVVENAIEKSLKTLNQQIDKEISIYDITPIGTVDSGGFYMLHATSAARLNFESILSKSKPIFQSVEVMMEEQGFEPFKGRYVVFENFYDEGNTFIFSSGVGTKNQIAIPDDYEVLSKPIKRGRYFKTQLTGDYINLKQLLEISESTIKDKELVVNQSLKPFLEFEIDANDTVNPANWITNFYIPIVEN